DQVTLLKTDNILADGTHGFEPFGIEPTTVESILPTYLDQYCKGGRFSRFSSA
ncbi:MAG TPA: complex I NDUFA9 subunit family protein, partial [Rhodospirillaceae bacterium]|nr:complex I NDUFA9 subunit family protein [Rhodospirillaceae bacterium]